MSNSLVHQMYKKMIQEVPAEQVEEYKRGYRQVKEKYGDRYDNDIEPMLVLAMAGGVSSIELLRAAFFIGVTTVIEEIEKEKFNEQFSPAADA